MPAWSVPGTQRAVSPQHAVPAGQDVRLGVLEHVAHVQVAGDVGRREEHGKGGAAVPTHVAALHEWGTRSLYFEEAFADPVVGPALLDGGGVVGLGKVAVGGFGGGFCGLLVAHSGRG